MRIYKRVTTCLVIILMASCKNSKTDVIDFVPSNSIFLLKMSQVKAPLISFNESNFWEKYINKNQSLTSFKYDYKQILRVLAADEINENIDQIFLSLILSGTYDVDMLLTLQLKSSLIKRLIEKAEAQNIAVYSSFYQTYAIYQFNLDAHTKGKSLDQIYLCQFNNILFVSPSRLLIEDGLKYSMTDQKITDDPIFKSLYESSSISDPINIFVNHKEFNKVKFLPENNFMQFFKRVKHSSWSKMDFFTKPDFDNLQTFTILDKGQALSDAWNTPFTTESYPTMMDLYCDRTQVKRANIHVTYLNEGRESGPSLDDFFEPTSVVCIKGKKHWIVLETKDNLQSYLSQSKRIRQINAHTYYNPHRKLWYQLLDQRLWVSNDTVVSQVLHDFGYRQMPNNNLTHQTHYFMNQRKASSDYTKNEGLFKNIWEMLNYYNSAEVSSYQESNRSFVSNVNLYKRKTPTISVQALQYNEAVHELQFVDQPYYSTVDLFSINSNEVLLSKLIHKQVWKRQTQSKLPISHSGKIDWYRNQKYQFWYTAGNMFYLYPRDGALHRKLHFKSLDSIEHLSAVYYTDIKKYRFIASHGKQIQIKDREGNAIKGFRYDPKYELTSPMYHINQSGTDFLLSSDTQHKVHVLKRNGARLYSLHLDSVGGPPKYQYDATKQRLMIVQGNQSQWIEGKLGLKDSLQIKRFDSEQDMVLTRTKLWAVKGKRLVELTSNTRWKTPTKVQSLQSIEGTDELVLNGRYLGYFDLNKQFKWTEIPMLERFDLVNGYVDIDRKLYASFRLKKVESEQPTVGGMLQIKLP